MADYDGHVKIGTELDSEGLEKGLSGIGGLAKKGFSVLGNAAAAAAKTAAAAVTAGMSAVTGIVGASVAVGREFEAEMSTVESISGAAGDELEALKEKAKEMGASTKFSATQSAEALEYMAMAGWKTADMLNGIEGVMNLAAASGEDLATTSDIVTDAMTAFQLAADGTTTVIKDGITKEVANAAHFADVLAKASSNANTNVGMMGETFKYVAPVAGAMGYSIEDTAVAIGLMANSGIKAGQAGTSLRAMMSRMAKPTKDVAYAMEELGISITDSEGNMKPLNELMIDMRSGFSSLSEAESINMATTIAGQEAMSGLLAIVNASDEDFAKLAESIADCDGAAADMAETAQNNLNGQLTIMRSSAEALGIQIYESIQSPLTDLAKYGVSALGELNEAFRKEGTNGLVRAGSRIIGDILTGAAKELPGMINLSFDVVENLLKSFQQNMPNLIGAGEKILGALAEGTAECIPLLSSIALQAITAISEGILNNLPAVAESGGNMLQELVGGIQEMFPELLNIAVSIMEFLLTSISENAPEMLRTGTEMLTSFMDGIAEKLPELVPLALNALLEFATGVVDNLPQLIDAGIRMLSSLAEGVINALPQLITKVPYIINTFADTVYSLFPKILQAGWDLIKSLGQGIVNNWPLIRENAGEIVKAIINVFSLVSLASLGKNIIKSLGKGLSGMKEFIGKIIKEIIEKIKHPFKGDTWSKIGKDIIEGIKKGLLGAVKGLKDAAVDAAKSALGAITDFLGIHSPSRLMRDVVGKNMIAGIGVGIEEETPDLEESSADAAGAAVRAMRDISAQDAVESIKRRAYDMPGYTDEPHREDGPQEKNEAIDYEKMGEAMRKSLSGTKVVMDKKQVGVLVTPVVNEELEKEKNRKT